MVSVSTKVAPSWPTALKINWVCAPQNMPPRPLPECLGSRWRQTGGHTPQRSVSGRMRNSAPLMLKVSVGDSRREAQEGDVRGQRPDGKVPNEGMRARDGGWRTGQQGRGGGQSCGGERDRDGPGRRTDRSLQFLSPCASTVCGSDKATH